MVNRLCFDKKDDPSGRSMRRRVSQLKVTKKDFIFNENVGRSPVPRFRENGEVRLCGKVPVEGGGIIIVSCFY